MSELNKSKRASLLKKDQRVLIENILEHVTIKEAANVGGVSERTIRDWRRGKFTMDYDVLQKLCAESGVSLPTTLHFKERYWYTSVGGKVSGPLHWKRYGRIGNETNRLKKWREWWNKHGKYEERTMFARLPFKKPRRSTELAEFFGIMLGDGGMTNRQVMITLHAIDDKAYSNYVSYLMEKLFDVMPRISSKKPFKAIMLYVSRSNLSLFLHQNGLKIGNKIEQNVDIPKWILQNKSWARACVRGLIDTDGSVFGETHKYKKKRYTYHRIHFVSASKKLRHSVYRVLCQFDLKPFLRHNVRRVSIEGTDVAKYFEIFGSSNPKHWKRYRKLVGGVA